MQRRPLRHGVGRRGARARRRRRGFGRVSGAAGQAAGVLAGGVGVLEALEVAITAQVLTEALRRVEVGDDAARRARGGVAEAGCRVLVLGVGLDALVRRAGILGLDFAAPVGPETESLRFYC